MRDMIVAAATMRSVVGDTAGNLERADRLAAEASRRGADVLVLPEACLTGYTVRQAMCRWAESVPGPLTGQVMDMARRHGLILAVGLVEPGPGETCHLTQALIGPSGLWGSYRKTHLSPNERKFFSPGENIGLIETDQARYGVQLCYEGHFPEISLVQALAGAEVILIPHASPRETPRDKFQRWVRYMPARAYDNTVFVVGVNPVGDNGAGLTFAGAALIAGPKGQILAEAQSDRETVITAQLSADDLRAIKEGPMGYFLPQRRPKLYDLS